jgi:hypothetical protein
VILKQQVFVFACEQALRVVDLGKWFSNLNICKNFLECAKKTLSGFYPTDSVGSGGAQELAFLTSLQMMSMLQIQGLHFGNHSA